MFTHLREKRSLAGRAKMSAILAWIVGGGVQAACWAKLALPFGLYRSVAVVRRVDQGHLGCALNSVAALSLPCPLKDRRAREELAVEFLVICYTGASFYHYCQLW